MRVYAAELICSTGVSGFQTFKPVFCIYKKLRLHAEMLSKWVNDVIFSRSNPLMSKFFGQDYVQFWTWVMADRQIQNLHSK